MGKLNAKLVKSLSKPGMHNDGHGLYLQITPPDGRSWILRTRVHRRVTDIGLGSAHLFSLAEAREEARRLRKIARSGGDPRAERSKEVLTFSEAAQRTYATKAPSMNNEKAKAQWLSSLRTYAFPAIGEKDIATITSADIITVLAPIWHEKHETARRVRQRMEATFTWAKGAGHYPHENPVTSVNKDVLGRQRSSKKHFEAMPWADVPEFFALLEGREALSAKALQFCILCGSRSGEVRSARWVEIDFEEAVWVIPAERMKGSKEHRVPLSTEALKLLRSIEGLGQDFIFPTTRRNKDGSEKPLSENGMIALLKRMGVEGVTVHGFRSSFRQWGQERSQASHEVLERCLAHTVGNAVSQAYARSDMLDERRKVMDTWARFVARDNQEKVVQLHG